MSFNMAPSLESERSFQASLLASFSRAGGGKTIHSIAKYILTKGSVLDYPKKILIKVHISSS